MAVKINRVHTRKMLQFETSKTSFNILAVCILVCNKAESKLLQRSESEDENLRGVDKFHQQDRIT